ncbi:uncharacterized protein LOC132707235 [Cylas formicarius]|uniref:uncharacterized protein LOC132707235 n=1 Tax=Cylas formicarius TaxID=197179 RepID=UPI002958A345|nr:uncharacterized protein LOC132707235 [Cylas formicarius]
MITGYIFDFQKFLLLFSVIAYINAQTTTQPVTGPISCNATANYSAAACDQYYECVQVFWLYYVVLQTCPSGQAYNSTSQLCEDKQTCVNATTATTTSFATATTSTDNPVTAPASCSTDGTLYPSSICNQYYQCVRVLWLFYVVQQTCPAGQSFNSTACEVDTNCIV